MESKLLLEIILAVLVITATISIILILYPFIFKRIYKKTIKTKTKLDDILLEVMKTPIAVAIFIIGASIMFKVLQTWFTHQEFINKFLIVIWGCWVIWIAERILHASVRWYAQYKIKEQTNTTSIIIFQKIFAVIIYIVVALLVLRNLGLDITPLLASIGLGGLTVALALQKTLSNYFSSIYLSSDKAIRIGDYIELENGVDGYVEEIGWRSVKLRTLTNNYVIIPNSIMADTMIKNFSQPDPSLDIKIPFVIAYTNDLRKVESVIMKTARTVLRLNKQSAQQKVLARFKRIRARGIEVAVFITVNQYIDQYKIIHDFIRELLQQFKKNKIHLAISTKGSFLENEDEKEIFE